MAFLETPARKLLLGGASMARTVADDAGPGFHLDGAGRFFSAIWELIKVKAAELPGLLCALSKKADDLFPPETRSATLDKWVYFAATVVVPAVLGALWLLFLARCCRLCCAAAARGRRMVVPRRRRARVPRDAFDDDTRRYFGDLRGRKPLEHY